MVTSTFTVPYRTASSGQDGVRTLITVTPKPLDVDMLIVIHLTDFMTVTGITLKAQHKLKLRTLLMPLRYPAAHGASNVAIAAN